MPCSSHSSNFIFHATDPDTNEIVDFSEFFARPQGEDGSLDIEAELITKLGSICTVEKITVCTMIMSMLPAQYILLLTPSLLSMQAFANIEDYQYPNALDTHTIVIFVLCVILVAGAFTSLVLAVRQRWVYVVSSLLVSSCCSTSPSPYSALHDTRSKLLADVFYGSPGSTSLVENVQTDNFQLEEMEMKGER